LLGKEKPRLAGQKELKKSEPITSFKIELLTIGLKNLGKS